ncbi:hypothetical protein [Leptothoe kymatousa]|uniref:Lipoprotein n=1 Tax=Leptothoe kymatousa TAU-MAC 1615 TaxID=2364775 RepID=A0ABS5Y6P2_9CYAN|nr:hypothetical protein [Leptothoe kymatousa]MBT9313496.1 hypothetical protein [Leptothoe kymatousa TAU-MAC 1615]
MPLAFSNKCRALVGLLALLSVGCSRASDHTRTLTLHQSWPLAVGTEVAGYTVSSGLGDITLNLRGDNIHMPFDGTVEATPVNKSNCVLVSSGDVPAYLFRLCGVRQAQLGHHREGSAIGSAGQLVFSMLRRQPDGTWAIVEPSPKFVEQMLAR